MTLRSGLRSVALLLLGTVPGVIRAQGGASGQIVDRIVAVVGTTPITASQVEEQLALMQSEGQQLPSDSAGRAALRRQILTQMVEGELLVQQAQRDTNLKVTDREVQDQVEQTVQNVRKQFTSGAEFQSQLRAAGFGSEEEWRRWLADNQRRSILRDRLLDELRKKGKLRPIPPSEAQMRTFWEQNRGQQSKRPASVSFRQIVITPKPDSAAKARARQLAESLVVVLRGGADFADVARRFSSDSGSREAGGELGWFRRGRMVKEFEDVAFRMRPGEISGVVETEFGYHVIQVERVQPAEVEARHVLIAPVISAAQLALARRLADSVHDALAGGASFDTLADALPASQLPPDYLKAIGKESVPGLKPVIAVAEGTARARFVVLELIRRLPEGEFAFEDVKDRIRDALSQRLAEQHYLDLLRRTTYVDIRL